MSPDGRIPPRGKIAVAEGPDVLAARRPAPPAPALVRRTARPTATFRFAGARGLQPGSSTAAGRIDQGRGDAT